MARRKPYTKVIKEDQTRAAHVKGMGDIVFKGFQCLNPDCEEFIFVRKGDISEFFEIECPTCRFTHGYGEESKFYDYELHDLRDNSILQKGTFSISHDAYVDEAKEFKYCIICNTLKPLGLFHQHSARKSGRQGECRLCKKVYNTITNPTRTIDQHREAAQKRRLYMDLADGGKIESRRIYDRFGYKCFKCGKDLSQDIQEQSLQRSGNLDHTLPAKYLWPLTTDNATLLCYQHNGEKSGKWPSEFYTAQELRKLVALTGIQYEILAGAAYYNPAAVSKLHRSEFVDALLAKYAAYMDEIIIIRNRILSAIGFDMFAVSKTLSRSWIDKANEKLNG